MCYNVVINKVENLSNQKLKLFYVCIVLYMYLLFTYFLIIIVYFSGPSWLKDG